MWCSSPSGPWLHSASQASVWGDSGRLQRLVVLALLLQPQGGRRHGAAIHGRRPGQLRNQTLVRAALFASQDSDALEPLSQWRVEAVGLAPAAEGLRVLDTDSIENYPPKKLLSPVKLCFLGLF